MKRKRRNHSPEFKVRIAFTALCGSQTVVEIAREHQLHATQVTAWKTHLREQMAAVFEAGREKPEGYSEREIEQLRAKMGELTMELDWLQKKSRHLSLDGSVRFGWKRFPEGRACAVSVPS